MTQHYEKAPILLANLMTMNMSAAARATGISRATANRWLVESRLGKKELQEVEFANVKAPYHQHFEHTLSMMVRELEHDTVSNLRRAAENAGWVEIPVYKDGHQTWRQIDPPTYQLEVELGMRLEGDWNLYALVGDKMERVPEMQKVKGGDAQVLLRTLETFTRRWKSTQQIDVNYSGIAMLGAEDTAKQVAQPAFDDSAADAQAPKLALPAPGSDYTPRPTVVVDADGTRRTIEPAVDPLLAKEQPKPATSVAAKRNEIPLPPPVRWEEQVNRPQMPPGSMAQRLQAAHDRAYGINRDQRQTHDETFADGVRDDAHRGFPVR